MKSWVLLIALFLCVQGSFAQDFALKRLDESPRHHEWVQIKYDDRIVHSFLVFPEKKEKTTAVIVIHENRGLSDWVRGLADQLAEAGFIAIAPDLLSGMGPGGGKTSDFVNSDAARQGIYQLKPEQVTADLNAVYDYVAKLPACNGKVAVSGFCWGGSQTFRFATNHPTLAAAFVFYGTGPGDPEDIARIACPVYGFYGGDDARVNATIPTSIELMKSAGKLYEPITYEGARHAFMRRGEAPNASEANKKARDQALARFVSLLKKI
ncbi:dienelactone hydrolase family protein [bacterium]|nr:dienelactone hydrolase family protein [bacterium]